MTPARLRDRKIGRARVAFVHAVDTASRPTDVVVTPTGRLKVASLEVTLLDLVVHPHRCGGLDNVAPIVANAVQEHRIDAQRIVDAAATYRDGVIQRLGYLPSWPRAILASTSSWSRWPTTSRDDTS